MIKYITRIIHKRIKKLEMERGYSRIKMMYSAPRFNREIKFFE